MMNLSFNRMARMALLAGLCILAFATAAAGNPEVTVTGEYTYYDNGSHTRNECVELAIQGARANALAKKFGTLVAQDVAQSQVVNQEGEQNRFFANSETSVRGEWVSDVGEPEVKMEFDSDYNIVVHCKVKGKAREISNAAMKLNASVIDRDGMVKKDFRHRDPVLLKVESPNTDAYLTVCLIDEEGEVTRLFPYSSTRPDNKQRSLVKKKFDYVLFDRRRGQGEHGAVDEFRFNAPKGPELNKIYIIASPNFYADGPWTVAPGTHVSTMDQKAFNNWVLEMSRRDPEMTRSQINVSIFPQDD